MRVGQAHGKGVTALGSFFSGLVFSTTWPGSFWVRFRFVFSRATCFQQLLRFVFGFVLGSFLTPILCFQQLLRFVFQNNIFFRPIRPVCPKKPEQKRAVFCAPTKAVEPGGSGPLVYLESLAQ